MRFQEPPLYLEKGSTGTIVNKLLGFLRDWAQKHNKGKTGIVLDGILGDTGVRWLKEYQKARGLEPDGGCGPKTRQVLLQDGFDFESEARKVDETCKYVQPDGSALYWVSGIDPTTDEETAERRFFKSRHRN